MNNIPRQMKNCETLRYLLPMFQYASTDGAIIYVIICYPTEYNVRVKRIISS